MDTVQFKAVCCSRLKSIEVLKVYISKTFTFFPEQLHQTKSEENIYDHSSWTIQSAIEESRYIIKCMKEEIGCPGVCIAVSLDGKTVWSEGFGFADVENRVLCTSKTVMRIASISKPITATAVGG